MILSPNGIFFFLAWLSIVELTDDLNKVEEESQDTCNSTYEKQPPEAFQMKPV